MGGGGGGGRGSPHFYSRPQCVSVVCEGCYGITHLLPHNPPELHPEPPMASPRDRFCLFFCFLFFVYLGEGGASNHGANQCILTVCDSFTIDYIVE